VDFPRSRMPEQDPIKKGTDDRLRMARQQIFCQRARQRGALTGGST